MQFKQMAKTTEGKSFLKIEDGQSVQGVLRGNPYDYRMHWVESKSVQCAGEDCALCKKGDRSKFRFKINFITKDDAGNYVAKVFEQGAKVYEALANLQADGFELEKTIIRISRSGKDKNTNYTIAPIKDFAVTEELETKLKSVPLQVLEYKEFTPISQLPF